MRIQICSLIVILIGLVFFFKARNVLNFEKMGKIDKYTESPKHLQACDPLLEF